MIRYLLLVAALMVVGGCRHPVLPEAPEGVEIPVCERDGNFETFVTGDADYMNAELQLGVNAFCIDGALDGIIGGCEGTITFQAYSDRVAAVQEAMSWMMLQGRLSQDDRFANDEPDTGTYSATHNECEWADGARVVAFQLNKIPSVELGDYRFAVVFELDEAGDLEFGVFGDYDLEHIAEWQLRPKELFGDDSLGETAVSFEPADLDYWDDPSSPE